MENFIIIVISIGALLYNVYKNYHKEMEKSRSRKPQAFPTPADVHVPAFEKIKEHKNMKMERIEPIYTPELPQEVKDLQMRKRMQPKKVVTVINDVEEIESENMGHHFDLKNAVIQAAILERPYK